MARTGTTTSANTGTAAAMTVYGTVAYVLFLAVFLYVIGFVTGLVVPKGIDDGLQGAVGLAVVIDLGLVVLFGLQHSVMARPGFKRWGTRVVPPVVERSTYVLASSAALALLMWAWRPLGAVVWHVEATGLRAGLYGVGFAGWALVLASTFQIDHFDLFGLRQVLRHQLGRPPVQPRFRTPLLYRWVRHPLMLGLLVAFWAAPTMSVGHLLFAAAMTLYIGIGVRFEERDLTRQLGDDYRRYQQQVPRLVPAGPRRRRRDR